MSIVIPVRGGSVVVDDSDKDIVLKYKWTVRLESRARTPRARGRTLGQRKEYLHRFLWRMWGLPFAEQIDHINRDALDCRRENLRAATTAQNVINRPGTGSSGLKGVTFHKQVGKWQAVIGIDNRRIYLGLFSDPMDAARAYNKAAFEVFGEFAFLNKISTESGVTP